MKQNLKGGTCSCSTAFCVAASISVDLSYCTSEPLDISGGCGVANSEASNLRGCRGLNLDVWLYCGLNVSEEEVVAFESGKRKRLLPELAADKEDALLEDETGNELGWDCIPRGSCSSDWLPISWKSN